MGIFEHGYGLVIGVGEYSDPAWNVPIAERDAGDIYAALADPAAGGYPPAQVEQLRGAEASSAAVLKAIERLAVRASAQDTVFIVVTSHGALAENNLYTLATSDAQFVDGARIRSGSGLSIAQLASALKSIRAERLLLVINACFAGYLGALASRGGLREAPTGSVIPNGESDTLLASGKGRALITASRADQRSYFLPDDTHSAFGQALIDSLRGVGINRRSGYIGLFELYGRVYEQVRKLAAMRGNPQDPVLNLVDGIGPFPVALHSGADSTDAGQIQQQPPVGSEVRTVQINIRTQNIDNSITSNIIGIHRDGEAAGDVNIGDVAGSGIIKNTNPPGATNIDSPLDRILPSRSSTQFIIPPIIIPSFDPPPIDSTPLPDDGGGPLIDLGNAQIGNFTIRGDVVRGNVSKTVFNQGGADEDEQLDPLTELQKIHARVEGARNVDEDARDDAANKIKQAHRALDQNDRVKALQRIDEALEILDAMSNGYIISITRKLRAVREAITL